MKAAAFLIAALLTAPCIFAEEEPAAAPTDVAVQVAKVIRTDLTRSITAYGTVVPGPTASAKLSPAMAGIITEINGVEGQLVKKGDVLFKLDSRAVDAAVAKAELGITFAQANVDRQKKLIAAEGTSAKQVLEAEQALAGAQTELAAAKVDQTLLRGEAPMTGTLVQFDAKPGEAADSTKALAEIVDLDRLVVALRIPRAEVMDIELGQRVRLSAGTEDAPITSSITFISPLVDSATDTVLVRTALPKEVKLGPGSFMTARIAVQESKDKLAVPTAAVYTDNEGESTVSVVSGDIARRVVVKTGLHQDDLIEIEGEGISAGAMVVTVGSYGLPEETKVHVIQATEEAK